MEFVHIELKRDTWLQPVAHICNPNDAIVHISKMIKNMSREIMVSVNLATDGTVINSSIISIGNINQSIISIQDIIRTAILSGGAAVILLHNHPSGSCHPSMDDRETTKKVAVACNIMGLELLDHIIIGENCYCSLNEECKDCFLVNRRDYENLMEGENEK